MPVGIKVEGPTTRTRAPRVRTGLKAGTPASLTAEITASAAVTIAGAER